MSNPGMFIAYTLNANVDVSTAEQGHAPQIVAATNGFVAAVKDWEKAALAGDLESAAKAKVLVAQYADQLEGLGQAKAARLKFGSETPVEPVPAAVGKDSRKLV